MRALLCFTVFFFAASLNAQSFIVTSAFQSFSGPCGWSDIPSPNWSPVIHNISGDTITLRWVRVEQNIPPWWRSSVCTELYCYSIPDDSATWNLLPGDSDMINIHIYPYGYTDTGNVVVKLFDVNNPSDSVRIMFHCDVVTGIEEYELFTYVAQNPQDHEITLSMSRSGTLIVMDELARTEMQFDIEPAQRYVIRLKPGVYFFTFTDEEGNEQIRKVLM